SYSLSVIANGNASLPFTFTFVPFPVMTSPLSLPAICSGDSFTYHATAGSTLTNMAWTRAGVTGISNPQVTVPQTTDPNEMLVNVGNISRTAVYNYVLTQGTCT